LQGKPIGDDAQTLSEVPASSLPPQPFFPPLPYQNDGMQAGIKAGAKIMLIGTPEAEVAAVSAPPPAAAAAGADWDASPGKSSEPLSRQAQHAKVS
jgi:hypothetical protein